MMQPSRRARRDLERRADRLLRSLDHRPVDPGARPETHAVLLTEGTEPSLATRELMMPILASVGLEVVGLADLLTEIDAAQSSQSPKRMPVIILIDGWMQVAWKDVVAMQPGGEA